MGDVTLVLKASNEDYIRKMKEAQREGQKVYDIAEKGTKREKGLIEDIENELTKLTEKRRKAYSVDDITKYNQKIAEAKKDLQEYEKAGGQVEKQTESMTQSIGRWATGLLGAGVILRKLGDAFKDTIQGMSLFNTVGAVMKTVLNDIVSGVGISITRMAEAAEVQKKLNMMILENKLENLKAKKALSDYNELYFKASDQRKTDTERIELLTKAQAKHTEAINIELKSVIKERDAYQILYDDHKNNLTYLNRVIELDGKIIDLTSQMETGSKFLERQKTALQEKQKTDNLKIYFDWLDRVNEAEEERLERQKKYNDLSKKLVDQYEKAGIDILTGTAKLKAQKDFELKVIAEFKKEMEGLAKLTPEQEQMFVKLGELVDQKFIEGLNKGIETQEATIEKTVADVLTKIYAKQKVIQQPHGLSAIVSAPTIWDELGLNPDTDEGRKNIENAKEVASIITGIISDIYDKRVEDAQRTRELYDTRISELQQEVEAEVALYKAGYASNVTLKQQELAALKIERDKALREEEKAIDKQRKLELILQEISLATSAAKLIQAGIEKGGLYGLILAAAEIAAMFVMFDAYKNQAETATRLATGGSGTDKGIVTGRSHAAGGERFLNQVEVERGEAWGVLSVPATQKFGKVFHEMVSSFNKGEIPVIAPATVNNKVMVENSGPNSRLDRLIRENQKLNEKLSIHESVQDTGSARIIRKNDNIRVINR